MKFVKNCAFAVSLFALAICGGASQANAQSLRGSFNLPFEAHWGNVTLEPGQYTLSLPSEATLFPVLFVSSQGKTKMILVGTSAAMAESDRSYLRVENIGETHVIRQFRSGPMGKVLTFNVSKSARNEDKIARNMPDLTLPVVPTGGR